MPKSRRRKKKVGAALPLGVVRMTPEIHDAFLQQREAFRVKFGRDPGASDPVFFDPDAAEPVPMSAVKVVAETIEAMRKAGTPPQIIYAYKKTRGLLLMESMRDHWPPDRVKEWDDAINE